MSTSFIQFQYCPLCRISHKQRKKKHIYSSRHQTILKNALTKFGKKISDGRAAMSPPQVQPHGWEADARFWCYFCQKEVNKHKELEDCTLVCGGLIEHASSKEHAQKMAEFFWENIIPADRKKEFIIKNEDYNRYLVQSASVIADFQAKAKERLAQEAARIAEAERRSQFVKWMGMREQHAKQTSSHAVSNVKHPANAGRVSSSDDGSELVKGKRTIAAYGEGLTCIIRPEVDEEEGEGEGNIFTGATPPWMREDEDEGQKGEVGPTMDDFKKHLERERKRKLPACRVGAKFDHKADTAAEWLPSFGRVWNHGRRLNSQHQFFREKKAPTATITSADMAAADASSLPEQPSTSRFVPYKRKRTEYHARDHSPLTEESDECSVASRSVPDLDATEQSSDFSAVGAFSGFTAPGKNRLSSRNNTLTSAGNGLSVRMNYLNPGVAGSQDVLLQSYTSDHLLYMGQQGSTNSTSVSSFGDTNQHTVYPLQAPDNSTSEPQVGLYGLGHKSSNSLYVMPYQRRRQMQTTDALNVSSGLLSTKLLATPVLSKLKHPK